MTSPLPPVNEDPALAAGQQARAEFTAQAAAVRGDFGITDIAKAQRITDLWNAANAKIAAQFADLQSRRRARQDALESVVPVGPNIPANASAADAAVLQQAFRSALAQARAASPTVLADMLADAERFDDDTVRRAVLTAALESSQMNLVQGWTDMLGLTEQLTELMTLRDSTEGRGFDSLWVSQALSPIPQPSEVVELPRLLAAQDAAVTAAGQLSSRIRSSTRGSW